MSSRKVGLAHAVTAVNKLTNSIIGLSKVLAFSYIYCVCSTCSYANTFKNFSLS